MRVLAIDTTTEQESVAVVEGGMVHGEIRFSASQGHSRHLLPNVAFLLEGLGLKADELDAYAVTTGPGSFTGLRVGISTVQGLALASRRPCIGIPALDVLAVRIVGSADCLVAVMDAFRDQIFAGVYDAFARPLGPHTLEDPESLIGRLPPVAAFVGDGAERYRARILESRPGALFPRRSRFLAGTLGLLAEGRLAGGEGIGPESLRPLYLRGADIRRSGR